MLIQMRTRSTEKPMREMTANALDYSTAVTNVARVTFQLWVKHFSMLCQQITTTFVGIYQLWFSYLSVTNIT